MTLDFITSFDYDHLGARALNGNGALSKFFSRRFTHIRAVELNRQLYDLLVESVPRLRELDLRVKNPPNDRRHSQSNNYQLPLDLNFLGKLRGLTLFSWF